MTLHERINTFENEARGRIRRVLATGNEKLMHLDEALAKVAKDDWSVPRLRERAEHLRASALKRAGELPGEAVSKLASGTRAPIQNLAKGLADFAKRIEPAPAKPVEAKPPEPKAP
jgi:pilus assembly protein TadC